MMSLFRCPLLLLLFSLLTGALFAQSIPVLTNPSACGLALPIIDNNCPEGGVFYQPNLFNIVVNNAPGTTLGVDVYLKEVRLVIRHGWAGDIEATLVSPGGDVALITADHGGGDDNYGDPDDLSCGTYASFAVGACTPLENATAPFTASTYQSDQSFYIFNDGVTNANGTWQLRICDDVADDAGTLEYIELVFEPISCLPVSQVSILNVDTTSVLVGWTPEDFCGTTIIEYGPPGFVPGTLSEAGVGGAIMIGNCSPFLLQGLQAESTYDIYVRRECAPNTYSLNSCVISVSTGCQPPPITIVENFDNEVSCDPNCGVACNTTGLWRNVSGDAFDWIAYSGPTTTSGTGPLDDVTGGGKYMYIETTGNQCASGASARLLSPCVQIDKQGFPDCHLSFHYHMFGPNIGTLRLEVSTNGGFTWSPFWQLAGSQGNAWKKIYLSLAAFPDGQVLQFRFVGVKGNGVRGDIAIDQIVFYGSQNLGFPDNQYYVDSDGDGFGAVGNFVLSCASIAPAGYADNDDDCNDMSASVFPGAPEIGCDGIDNNCNGNADDAILPPPVATSDTICSGEQAVVCATPLPGYFMLWHATPTGNDVLFFGECYEPVLPPNNSTAPVVYRFYAEQTNFACFSEPRTEVVVVVNPVPSAVIEEMPSVCPGESFDLASLNIVDTNFTGGVITFHTQSPATPANIMASTIVNPATTTDYYFLITNPYGCTDEGTITLTVLNGPQLSFLPASAFSLCKESTTTVTVQASGGSNDYTYFWSTGASTPSIVVSASGTAGTSTAYQVTVTDTDGCTNTDEVLITTSNSIDSIRRTVTNVSTCMGNDGAIQVIPLNGLQPFSYNWTGSNGLSGSGTSMGDTILISGLSQGNYRVTITDGSSEGCRFILRNVLVQGPSAVIEDIDITNVSCAGAADGAICMEVDGNNLQFLWSNDETTSCIENLSGGTYAVTVTAGMCATVIDNLVVLEPDSLKLKPNLVHPLCHDSANGAIMLSVFDGTPPYSFLWNNTAITPNISGLVAGDYIVTITDANDCTLIDTITLTAPLPLQVVQDSLQTISCNGAADGYLKVSGAGGTLPYRFLWQDGITSPLRADLAPGTYTVTLTDFRGCQTFRSFNITQPDILAVNISSTVQPVCDGDESGSLMVSATGGTAPFQFFWSNGDVGASITNLGVGTYRVVAEDANGCISDTLVVNLLPTSTLGIGITIVPPTCVGRTDGSISLQVAGTPPFQYEWNDNSQASTLSNIGVGTYTVNIQDGQGCVYDTAIAVTAPQVFGIQLSAVQPSCYGVPDGLIDLIMLQSGTPPITYQWSNSASSQDIAELAPGTYRVTVNDGNGCKFISQDITLTWPEPLTYKIDAIGQIECHGETDGFIEWTVSGGTPPYDFTWFGLGTDHDDVYNLAAGSYRVLVQDSRDCPIDTVFVLSQPAPMQLAATAILGSICDPVATDSLAANASGGTPPYTYLWSNGAMSANISNAEPGDYLLTVTDAKGCEIRSTTVKVPERVPPVQLQGFNATGVSCFGGNDASMTATISGGSGLYLYHFSPTYIETTSASSVTVGQLLYSPSYSVTITDLGTGCVVSSMSQSPDQPPPLTVTRESTTMVNCFGGSDGAIDITVSGGVMPYTYQWLNAAGMQFSVNQDVQFISAGDYTVIVSDANGCQETLLTTITGTGNTVIQIVDTSTIIQNLRCRNDSSGAIDITLSGGTPPFMYSWSNGAHTEDLIGIPAGIYELTVTDADTCRSIFPGIIVTQPAQSLMPHAQLLPPDCHDTQNGAIITAPTGGVPPYTYMWQDAGITLPNETGNSLQPIAPGNYRLILQDANMCVRFFDYALQAPDTLEVGIEVTQQGASIFAMAMVEGGTADYTYLWSNDSTSNEIEIFASGFYSVTVTDANGCEAVATVFVSSASDAPYLNNLKIYPNPTRDWVQIELSLDRAAQMQWVLYDAQGRKLWQENSNFSQRETRLIDLSAYPQGAYLLQLWAEGHLLFGELILKAE